MSETAGTEGTDQSQGDGGTTVNTDGGDAVVQTGGESTTGDGGTSTADAPSGEPAAGDGASE